MQMDADRRRDHREERENRLAVQGLEINRGPEKTQRDLRLGDVQHERIARVRHGDALADAGGFHRFPRQEHFQQQLAVGIRGQMQDGHERTQGCFFVGARQLIKNTARLQRA